MSTNDKSVLQNNMGIFCERFKSLYLEKEYLNIREAALDMNVSLGVISNSINYGIIPKPKTLINIADCFNCSINYLLGRTSEDRFIKSINPTTFVERLTSLKEEKRISFYKLSNDLHIDQNLISAWYKRNFIPALENLDLLADYFKCTIDYLLGRTDVK